MKKNLQSFHQLLINLTRDYSEDSEEFSSTKIETISSNEPESISQVLNLHTFF